MSAGLFFKQAALLASGAAIAQIISILASPILTRLYSPEDFGLLAIFLSALSITAFISTGRYELAITIPKSSKEASNLVSLSIFLSLMFSAFLYIPIIIFGKEISKYSGIDGLHNWLLLLPLSTIGMGVFNTFNFWFNRQSDYQFMALNQILKSAITVSLNIIIGILNVFGGMIIGNVIGSSIVATIISLKKTRREFSVFNDVNWRSIYRIAKKYKSFPTIVGPAQLIGVVGQQLPILLIPVIYSPSTLGFYYLADRFITLPTGVIANAVGNVYRQRISEEYNESSEFRGIFLSTIKYLLILAVPPLVIFGISAPLLFEFVFGAHWRVAGEYSQIIAFMCFFQFISVPVDKGSLIVGAVRYIFYWQLSRLLLTILICWLAYSFVGFTEFLAAYCLTISFLFVIDIVVQFLYSGSAKGARNPI